MSEKRLCIGKISSAHGVKGLVKILPYCEDLSLLEGKLFTSDKGNETLTITLKNPSGKYILAQIEGINSKEDADKLKAQLYIPRDELPDIEEDGSYYITDLVGLKALDTAGELIGTIKAVQNYGAGDLLEIQPKIGASYFIPFQDEFVTDINLDLKQATLDNFKQFIIE